jgi:beta-glucosidase
MKSQVFPIASMENSKVIPKHDHATLTFPEGFLWGASTSAHQVEGNNIHSDWWAWEQKLPEGKRSHEACDHYHLFEEDFDLAQKLNHNAHRLSVEWARIEPEEGKFDYSAIQHYQEVLAALKKRGMKVMVTLHHFSNPQWFSQKGGWENGKAPEYFEKFLKVIVPELKESVDFWITINEPTIYVWRFYLGKNWPNAQKSNFGMVKTYLNFASAHKRAYKTIHKLDPGKPVGISQNVQTYEAFHKHSLRELLAVAAADFTTNHLFYFLTHGYHDFLGINYYFHHRLNGEKNFIPKEVNAGAFSKDVSDLGWEVYPEGIFSILTDLSDHLPIYITECGIASINDDRRIRFLMHYLQEVNRAIKAGVNVKGFFYWSLLDNFEWTDGFDARFGLIEVDYRTEKRLIRPSALVYADIIKNNGIRHDLMKFLGHRIHADDVIEIPGVGKIPEAKIPE